MGTWRICRKCPSQSSNRTTLSGWRGYRDRQRATSVRKQKCTSPSSLCPLRLSALHGAQRIRLDLGFPVLLRQQEAFFPSGQTVSTAFSFFFLRLLQLYLYTFIIKWLQNKWINDVGRVYGVQSSWVLKESDMNVVMRWNGWHPLPCYISVAEHHCPWAWLASNPQAFSNVTAYMRPCLTTHLVRTTSRTCFFSFLPAAVCFECLHTHTHTRARAHVRTHARTHTN